MKNKLGSRGFNVDDNEMNHYNKFQAGLSPEGGNIDMIVWKVETNLLRSM